MRDNVGSQDPWKIPLAEESFTDTKYYIKIFEISEKLERMWAKFTKPCLEF